MTKRLIVLAVLLMVLAGCAGGGPATGYDYGYGPRSAPIQNGPTNPGTGQ